VSPVAVPNEGIATHAARLAAAPSVGHAELALAFAQTAASSAELHVEGRTFLPAAARRHRRRVVVGPHQPVRLPARPRRRPVRRRARSEGGRGRSGAADRRPSGHRPERGSRELYERLTAAGVVVCVNRATQPRAPRGPRGCGGTTGWNLCGQGHIDHRKVVVADGRIGWVGGAGIEDHIENGSTIGGCSMPACESDLSQTRPARPYGVRAVPVARSRARTR
jgi:hypothetical protein